MSEIFVSRLETLLEELADISGEREVTSVVPGLVVIDAAPTGLTNYVIVRDNRDGDYIPAKTVPGVLYAANDIVSVLFIKGAEPIAFQQSPESSGSPIAVSKLVSPDGTIDPVFSVDNSSHSTAVADVSGNSFAFVIENTSGATANAGDLGYVDDAGEYKTTSTANEWLEWVVVIQGGVNNTDIYVSNRGRVTVNYAGTAPNTGEFLTTSTTAGSAKAQATMRPEIMAVCLENGSGGTVSVLLLTQTTPRTTTLNNNVYRTRAGGTSVSDWSGAIATLPGGSDLTYTTSGGTEDNLEPDGVGVKAKLTLHNTTQGDSALINDTNTATNTITLLNTVPVGWATSDVITLRSQTNTSTFASGRFIDFEFNTALGNQIDVMARAMDVEMTLLDTGAGNIASRVHPFESNSSSKRDGATTQVANITILKYSTVELIDGKFQMAWGASGAGTVTVTIKLKREYIAAP